jgi:cellulose synthase/poly-beta-1,6-N-acetylglucosamine synthase-like glycosyltransferase
MEPLFWAAAGIVIYVYAGYPVLLTVLNRLFHRPVRKEPVTPSVSLLVAAYNEAGVIADKIRNSLGLDYPGDKLEVVIASDGSSDATVALAREFEDGRRVRVFDFPHNRGKLATLNESIPRLSGDIVAFSDASSMLLPDAMRRLVASFADRRAGAVSGVYKVRKKDEAQLGASEDLYWKYETFLKLQEAGLGSILGCHGSLYAIRRELYPFPKPGTINDDYVIPLRILQCGYRIAYEPGAVATEEAREMGGFSRRVRVMTGNFEQLAEMKYLVKPLRPLALFFFLSHKAGRLVVPLAMLAALIANIALRNQAFYGAVLAAQLAFYALAILGAVWQLRPKLLRLPYYFSMINAAAFLGMYYVTLGRHRMVWRHK